jgi:hypothetical protein
VGKGLDGINIHPVMPRTPPVRAPAVTRRAGSAGARVSSPLAELAILVVATMGREEPNRPGRWQPGGGLKRASEEVCGKGRPGGEAASNARATDEPKWQPNWPRSCSQPKVGERLGATPTSKQEPLAKALPTQRTLPMGLAPS